MHGRNGFTLCVLLLLCVQAACAGSLPCAADVRVHRLAGAGEELAGEELAQRASAWSPCCCTCNKLSAGFL